MSGDLYDPGAGHRPDHSFDREASKAEERRFVASAADGLRAIADELDRHALDHEALRRRLHEVTWPLHQAVDPAGHTTDFLMRNALYAAIDREGFTVDIDEQTLDNLAWALTRDGWWPRPGAWEEGPWDTWRLADHGTPPRWIDEP